MDDVVEKYMNRLKEAGKVGMRCCPIDSYEEKEQLVSKLDGTIYYFTQENENEPWWLNWE